MSNTMFLAKLMLHMYQTLKMLRKKENEEIHPYIYICISQVPQLCARDYPGLVLKQRQRL